MYMFDDGRLPFNVLFFGACGGDVIAGRLAAIRETLDYLSPGRPPSMLTSNVTSRLGQVLFELGRHDCRPDVIFVSNEVGLRKDDYIGACQVIAANIAPLHNRPWIGLEADDMATLCRVFERYRIIVRCGPDAKLVTSLVTVRGTIYS